jgi:hypothetical protein
MKTDVCIVAGALLLFASCATTPLPPDPVKTIPDDFIGMVHAGRQKTLEEYALLDELGVTWILNTFYWSGIEPEENRWDFSNYDGFVDGGKKAGKKILAVLAYDTPWLYADGKTRKYVSKENLPQFLTFVEQTVTRYRGKVDAWEIWNEPNWIFWKGTKQEYFELTRAAVQKIKELDPDAPVIAGAFFRVPSKSYMDALFKSGAMEQVNAIAFHPYATSPASAVKLYDTFLNILDRHHFSGDVWVTEIGYPTGGWYPFRTSEDNLPSHVVKTIAGLAARGARAVLWYQLFDPYNRGEVPNTLDSEDFFGLVYPDYSKKKGALAYALCARYLAGTEYRRDAPERQGIPDSVVCFYFRGQDGQNTLVLWNDQNSIVPLQIALSGSGQLHDIVTGESSAVSPNAAIPLGKTPWIITWQDEGGYLPPRIVLAK